eukprot:6227652-Pyramimonas_sp.AAC.1
MTEMLELLKSSAQHIPTQQGWQIVCKLLMVVAVHPAAAPTGATTNRTLDTEDIPATKRIGPVCSESGRL